MANHVYFNIEIDGLTEEQHNCLFKSEVVKRPHWREGEDPIEYQEFCDIHEQPFMSNVERTYDKDGWIEDSYMWYVNNCGAKWVSVDEWDYPRLQGYSAWSHPVQLVEHLLEYASQRFNVETSAIMTYEDEFRNFIGRDLFETSPNEEGNWYCLHSEEYIDGGDLNAMLEDKLNCDLSSDDFDWWDEYKDTGIVPQEWMDEVVYNFFDTGELNGET